MLIYPVWESTYYKSLVTLMRHIKVTHKFNYKQNGRNRTFHNTSALKHHFKIKHIKSHETASPSEITHTLEVGHIPEEIEQKSNQSDGYNSKSFHMKILEIHCSVRLLYLYQNFTAITHFSDFSELLVKPMEMLKNEMLLVKERKVSDSIHENLDLFCS